MQNFCDIKLSGRGREVLSAVFPSYSTALSSQIRHFEWAMGAKLNSSLYSFIFTVRRALIMKKKRETKRKKKKTRKKFFLKISYGLHLDPDATECKEL